MTHPAIAVNIGSNVSTLRSRKDLSMDIVVAKMNLMGYRWTRTTLINIEHGDRKLQATEAYDLLTALGYNPPVDLPLLYNTVEQTEIDDVMDECQRRAVTLQDSWNQYLHSSQYAAERIHKHEESDGISKRQGEELLHRLSSWEDSLKDAIEERRPENGAHLITWRPYRHRDGNATDSDNSQKPPVQEQ